MQICRGTTRSPRHSAIICNMFLLSLWNILNISPISIHQIVRKPFRPLRRQVGPYPQQTTVLESMPPEVWPEMIPRFLTLSHGVSIVWVFLTHLFVSPLVIWCDMIFGDYWLNLIESVCIFIMCPFVRIGCLNNSKRSIQLGKLHGMLWNRTKSVFWGSIYPAGPVARRCAGWEWVSVPWQPWPPGVEE